MIRLLMVITLVASMVGCLSANGQYDVTTGKVSFSVVRFATDTELDGFKVKTPSGVEIELTGYKSDPKTELLNSLVGMMVRQNTIKEVAVDNPK